MPTYIITMSWTDQAIQNIRNARERLTYGETLAETFGVEYTHIYMIAGDADLLAIVEAPNADAVAKFVLALSSHANVRTHTWRAWTQTEYLALIDQIPAPNAGPSATLSGLRRP